MDKLGSAKHNNGTAARHEQRDDSLDQDIYRIEIEERLKGHMCENEERP